jgi:hypothetical protein
MSHGAVAPEVEVWLSACGLSPQLHGHMLKAAGITRLIHFKVTPIDTMRSELQKTDMEVGDIELVIAGVHWYLEWRDAVEPKDSFPEYFTESGFELFLARWNPNQGTAVAFGASEVRRNRDPPTTTKANLAMATSASVLDDTAHLASDTFRTTTTAPRIPTGELVDAKNTVQSHSLLAHAVAEQATAATSDSPFSKQEPANARSPDSASSQAAVAYAVEASHDDTDLEPPPLSANVFAVAARIKDGDEEEAGSGMVHQSDPSPQVPQVSSRRVFKGDSVDDDDEESLSQHSGKPPTLSPAIGNERTGPVSGRRQWQIRLLVAVVAAMAIIVVGVLVYAAPWRNSSRSQSASSSKNASSMMNTPVAPTPNRTSAPFSANVLPSLAPQLISSSTGSPSTVPPTGTLAASMPVSSTSALTPPMPTLAPTAPPTMMPTNRYHDTPTSFCSSGTGSTTREHYLANNHGTRRSIGNTPVIR